MLNRIGKELNLGDPIESLTRRDGVPRIGGCCSRLGLDGAG